MQFKAWSDESMRPMRDGDRWGFNLTEVGLCFKSLMLGFGALSFS